MSRGAILAQFRFPTQEEYDQYLPDALERLWRKHPQLRGDDGRLREDDGFVDEMINAMIVWMADTPDWANIP